MNEIITANDVEYTAKNVTTGIETISFTLADPVTDAEAAFREAKSLTVGDAKGTVYGQYPDVEFTSLTINADESITVAMHILTKTEKQTRELQVSQTEQDEVLAEILYGGEAQ